MKLRENQGDVHLRNWLHFGLVDDADWRTGADLQENRVGNVKIHKLYPKRQCSSTSNSMSTTGVVLSRGGSVRLSLSLVTLEVWPVTLSGGVEVVGGSDDWLLSTEEKVWLW